MNTAQTLVFNARRTYVSPKCSCGWTGVNYPTRTVEGQQLAERDAADHAYAHEHGLGWFDYLHGWVPGPNDPAVTP
jgi:hypothetical protein